MTSRGSTRRTLASAPGHSAGSRTRSGLGWLLVMAAVLTGVARYSAAHEPSFLLAQAEPAAEKAAPDDKAKVAGPAEKPAVAPPAEIEPGQFPEAGKPAMPDRLLRDGQFLVVEQPINDSVDRRVRRLAAAVVDRAKAAEKYPVIVFEIRPGKSEFGQALDLAEFIMGKKLHGSTTVAYIPETLTGHAVLVALACDEIVMHEKAQLGEAGKDETQITRRMRAAYEDLCRSKNTLPEALVLGMLDKSLEVHQVETAKSTEYLLSDQLDATKRSKEVVKRSGEMGLFAAQDLRGRSLVNLLVRDRNEIAERYGLPREALVDDPSIDGGWRAVRIDLKGAAQGRALQVAKQVDQAVADGKNLIVISIDSEGGSPEECLALGNSLARLDPRKQRTVAYIHRRALSDALMPALGCDHIVAHPDAELGGSGNAVIAHDQVQNFAESAADLARQKNRSPWLAAAVFDPQLQVFRYEREGDGAIRYLTAKAAEDQQDAERWRRGEEVTRVGKPFGMTGRDGHDKFEVVWALAEDFHEFKAKLGLEEDPQLAEPGWAEILIDALAQGEVAWLLIFIGMAALMAELHGAGMGIGLGWLVSGVCFTIFFWSQFLGGTAGWLEVLLFAAGACCLLLEMFVLPGFGLFGLAGGMLVLTSLVLASQTFYFLPQNDYQTWRLTKSLLMLFGTGVGVTALGALMRHYLPHSPFFNRMILAPPTAEELAAAATSENTHYGQSPIVGQRGKAVTPLVPSGKVRVGDRLLDVVADDGGFIERGAEVVVSEVMGNRVVVKAV